MTDVRPIPDPTDRTTKDLLREVEHLRDLMEEKFAGVDKEFSLIERQRKEQKVDTTTAIEAALEAQKEAVMKSDTATEKQLDSFAARFGSVMDTVRRDLGALGDRVTAIEAVKRGATETVQSGQASIAQVVGLLMLVVALLAIGVGAFT